MAVYWEGMQKSWYPLLNGKSNYISLATSVAQKAASLMWARGVHVNSENETDKQHIDKIIEHNDFLEMLYTNEVDLSLNGNTMATIEVVNGMPTITLSDPLLFSRMGRSYVTKELAVVWKRINIDGKSLPVREIWDKEKVVRNIYSEKGEMFTVETATVKLKNAIPRVWYHNLGYVPVVHFKNRAGAFRMYSVPDHQFTGCLEQYYNKAVDVLFNTELENNTTKLYAKLDKKDKKQLKRAAKDANMSIADYMKQRSAIIETDFTGDKSGDKSNVSMQLIQGDPKFESYFHGLEMTKGEFFDLCGYSYQKPTQTGDARNTTDIVYANARDIETTKAKLLVRQTQVKELFDIVKDMYNKFCAGSIDGELTVDIKSNIMADSINEVEKSVMKIDAGITSRAHEISRIDGITLAEAEDKLKYIAEEQEEYPSVEEKQLEMNSEKDDKAGE